MCSRLILVKELLSGRPLRHPSRDRRPLGPYHDPAGTRLPVRPRDAGRRVLRGSRPKKASGRRSSSRHVSPSVSRLNEIIHEPDFPELSSISGGKTAPDPRPGTRAGRGKNTSGAAHVPECTRPAGRRARIGRPGAPARRHPSGCGPGFPARRRGRPGCEARPGGGPHPAGRPGDLARRRPPGCVPGGHGPQLAAQPGAAPPWVRARRPPPSPGEIFRAAPACGRASAGGPAAGVPRAGPGDGPAPPGAALSPRRAARPRHPRPRGPRPGRTRRRSARCRLPPGTARTGSR